jgi:hypothetical protein
MSQRHFSAVNRLLGDDNGTSRVHDSESTLSVQAPKELVGGPGVEPGFAASFNTIDNLLRQSGLASDIRKDRQVSGVSDSRRRGVGLLACHAHQYSDGGKKANLDNADLTR